MKKGWYYPNTLSLRGAGYETDAQMVVVGLGELNSNNTTTQKITEDIEINEATITFDSYGNDKLTYAIVATDDIVYFTVKKVLVDEYGQLINISVGDVYNVLDTGMNYAWNGTEWDALGGEHKDLEAREMIEELYSKLAKIEKILGTEADKVE